MSGRFRNALSWRWWYFRTLLWRGVLSRLGAFPSVFGNWASARNYCCALLSLKAGLSATSIRVRALGGKLLLCRPATSDPWVLWDVFRSEFQRPPAEVVRPHIIVDLGANVGYTAVWYAAQFPEAQILAVEMDATNYELARRNVEQFSGRCNVVNAAIWDSDGELEYGGGEEQGFKVTALDSCTTVNRRLVQSRSLNSLFEEFAIDAVDFVKMDIEGAESVVLRGHLEWLQRVRSLKIEVHPPMTLEECESILSCQGFQCRRDDRHDQCLIAVRASGHMAHEVANPGAVAVAG